MKMVELAKNAGISQSMVSLVLNGKAKGRISGKRQKLILDLAKKHNFRINHAAKRLRSKDKNLIGITMPIPCAPSYRARIVNLQNRLNELNYYGVFGFWKDIEQIPDTINRIMNLGVDALICWEYHPCLEKERIPIALYEQQKKEYDCVIIDYYDYVTKLIDYIQKLNHQKIGFIGNCSTESPHLRFYYLRQQLPTCGIEMRPEWIKYAREELQEAYEAFGEIMKNKEKPSLIVVANDIIAQGVYYKANELGMKIPDDISIIGSDNTDICEFLTPKLNSFSINADKLDSSLVELIIRRLKNPDSTCKSISVGVDFIDRESCRKI